MSPAKLTPAQIRDRKAKRVAIVLVVVFVVALAIQGPTILKLIHKSSPPVNAASVNVAAVSNGSSSATGVSATAVSAAAVGATTVSGQLENLSKFKPKDPFHAQNVTTTTTAAASSTPPAASTTTTTAKPPAATQATTTTTAKGATTPPPASATTTTALPFTVTTPAAPPNAAIVMTNGRREVVAIGADFPVEAPLFKLNALGKHADIRISVVGGSFTSGVKTIGLGLGKKLTFADESDGTRYVVKLVKLTTVDASSLPTPAGTGTTGSPTTPAGATTTAAKA